MELGLALLERLEGDAVLSPYGLARALGVFRAGATGATRAALDAVLSEPPPAAIDGLISAQAAWLGDDYAPGPKLTLDTGPLDADRVNAWSNEKTRGMIPRVVDSFTGDEILAITDAEYLDAKWEQPFTDTHQAPFEGAGEVPMMVVDGRFEHSDVGDPAALRGLRAALRGDARRVARAAVGARAGHGRAPAFQHDHVGRPGGPLIELGLGPAFEPSQDFEQLITGPGDKCLNRILQRARVDVDEAGTRAAATTVATMRAVSMPMNPFHLVFDRPFTWAVEHAPTGTLLFVGRVRNPTERSD